MDENEKSALMAKYLSGEMNIEEEQNFLRDLEKEGSLEDLRKAEILWQRSLPEISTYEYAHVDTELAWKKVQRVMQNSSSKNNLKLSRNSIWSIAASIALLVGIGMFWLFQSQDLPPVVIKKIKVNKNTMSILMPDSSKIDLRADAVLTYDSVFDKAERIVHFSGEGYFEITKNIERPFIIKMDRLELKVLGTSFSISTHTDSIYIALHEGKVELKTAASQATMHLNTGEAAVLKSGKPLLKVQKNPNHGAWHNKNVRFQNTPLTQVIEVLQNTFDVNIRLNSQNLKDCQFSGKFSNATLEVVLDALVASLNLNVKYINSNNIEISGNSCTD